MAFIDTKELAEEIVSQMLPKVERMIRDLMPKVDEDDLITISQAMKILELKTRKSVEKRIQDGRLTKYMDGKRIMLSRSQVKGLNKQTN